MRSSKGRDTKKKRNSEDYHDSSASTDKANVIFKFDTSAVPEESFEVFDFSESDRELRASFPISTKRKFPTRTSAENSKSSQRDRPCKIKRKSDDSILKDRINIVENSLNVNNNDDAASESISTSLVYSNEFSSAVKSDSLLKRFSIKGNVNMNTMSGGNKIVNEPEDIDPIEARVAGPSKQDDSSFNCPVCNQQLSANLTLREKEVHINSCLDGSSRSSIKDNSAVRDEKLDESVASSLMKQMCSCGKDLSKFDFLNAQAHLYKCKGNSTHIAPLKTISKEIKKSCTKKFRSKKMITDKKVCPLCTKFQCIDDVKLTTHLKQCATKHNVSTSKVLRLIKQIQCTGVKNGVNKENKNKRKKKQKNASVLIKYNSEIKKVVVDQMKQIQAAYQDCTNLLATTPVFKKSKVDELPSLNICNTNRKLWTLASAEINSDNNSCLYLKNIHKDIHESKSEVKNLSNNVNDIMQLTDLSESKELSKSSAINMSEKMDVGDQVKNVDNLDSNEKTILYSNDFEGNATDNKATPDEKKNMNNIDPSSMINDVTVESPTETSNKTCSDSNVSIKSCENCSEDIEIGNGFIDASKYMIELQTESSNDLAENLLELLESSFQSDFLFRCKDNAYVKAHSLFLSIRSSYLKQVILSGTKEIEVLNIPANVVQVVLKYLYTGLLPVYSEKNIKDIYHLSQMFLLNRLKEFCTLYKPELLVNDFVHDEIVLDNDSSDELFVSSSDQNKDIGNDSCFSEDELEQIQEFFQTQVKNEYSQMHGLNQENNCGLKLSDSEGKDSINVNDENCDTETETDNLFVAIEEGSSGKTVFENQINVLEVNDDKADDKVDKIQIDKVEDKIDNLQNDLENENDKIKDNLTDVFKDDEIFDNLITYNDNEMVDQNHENITNCENLNEDLSAVFFNGSLKHGSIFREDPPIMKQNSDKSSAVTVLVCDSETDLDETLDVDSVDEDADKALDENEEINISCSGNPENNDDDTVRSNDNKDLDDIADPMSPCLCSQIDSDVIHNDVLSEKYVNIESTPSKVAFSQSILIGTQQEITLKLNLTTNSPVPLSFGTPFLSGLTQKTKYNVNSDVYNTDDKSSFHPLDHAEATVIDEFAYEKLNNFLRETPKEPELNEDNSFIDQEFNDENEAALNNEAEDQGPRKSPENFTQGFSIDFQVSAADHNDSIDIISEKKGDILPEIDCQEKRNKGTKDLLGSNRKKERSSIASQRNSSECSDESISSGNSQRNINSFLQNRRSKRRKKMSQASLKTLDNKLSSDDNISESELPVNRSMLLKTQRISPHRSSERKKIKTYSTTSPFISKDNSWLSTKDSPKRKSMDNLITKRVKAKKKGSFKDRIAKQKSDPSSAEKGKNKKRTSFKDMVNKQKFDLSSTDDSVSDGADEVTCISVTTSKQSRSGIHFDDQDALIEDMFRTTSKNTSHIEKSDVSFVNISQNETVNCSNKEIIEEPYDETETDGFGIKSIDKPTKTESLGTEEQEINPCVDQNNYSFQANDGMDDFMDDGGYNSFVMNMECIENDPENITDPLETNDLNDILVNNNITNVQEIDVVDQCDNLNKADNNLMVTSCSIDDVLINFQTPGNETAFKSKLSSSISTNIDVTTPTNVSRDEFHSSTPLEVNASMDERSRQELIENCKNFRPGFHLHPKTKEPITPMPDYSSLPTPKLKDEMKKIALRNIPKHKMIAKMKEIYKFQHDFDHWEEEAKKAAPKKRAKGEAKAKGKEKVSKETESDRQSTDMESKTVDNKGRRKKKKKNSKAENEGAEELKASQVDSVSLDEKLMLYITSNPQLHHKVLTYTPLEFNVFFTLLKSSEIKCSKKSLELFLDQQCICYYTAKDEQQFPKRKSKKEKVAASKEA